MPVDLETTVIEFRKAILPDNGELDPALSTAVKNGGAREEIVRSLIGSAAFRQHYPRVFDGVTLAYKPLPIEVEVEAPVLRELLRKTKGHWEALGRTRPFWSVVSVPSLEKTDAETAEKRRVFYDGGQREAEGLLGILGRASVEIPFESALELGSGLGRITEPLAARFRSVVAMDVSAPHLEAAEAYCTGQGRTNVEYHLLTDVAEPFPGRHDFVITYHVLQHNPPPVMEVLLHRLFECVVPGGVAMIHVPVYMEGYTFNTQAYMKKEYAEGTIEMHAFPQKRLLELARQHGFDLVDVLDVAGRMRHRMISQLMTFRRR